MIIRTLTTNAATLRTSNPRIYAIGSATGARSAQAVQAQVGIVMKAAFFRLPVRFRADAVPICVATDPEIATVGITEDEAQGQGPLAIARWPFAETEAGWARDATAGHIKVVTGRRGRILGAGIVGPSAAEQIGFWALAIASGATLPSLAAIALPCPSWSEVSRRVIVADTVRRLRSPWIARTLGLLKRLG